jgi:hypothetical protein
MGRVKRCFCAWATSRCHSILEAECRRMKVAQFDLGCPLQFLQKIASCQCPLGQDKEVEIGHGPRFCGVAGIPFRKQSLSSPFPAIWSGRRPMLYSVGRILPLPDPAEQQRNRRFTPGRCGLLLVYASSANLSDIIASGGQADSGCRYRHRHAGRLVDGHGKRTGGVVAASVIKLRS